MKIAIKLFHMIVFYFQRSYVARMMKIMLGSSEIQNSFLDYVR